MHPFKAKAEQKVSHERAKDFTRGYKRGGKVNVNIHLHHRDARGAEPMPPPSPSVLPMGQPGTPPIGGAPIPPPGVGAGPFAVRARGGKVSPMTAGADSGEGRLQKAKWQKRDK